MGMINETHIVHDLTLSMINASLAKGELTNNADSVAVAYDEISRRLEQIFKG